MNLKQAHYFKTIAECGSITAAAKQLFVSQPSLSQMLRQIEDEIGLSLFDRSVSPMRLTFAGEKYLRAAERMLAANAELEAQLREIRQENTGRLRLGISVTRAMQVMPLVLPVFTAQYPNVALELTEAGSARQEELLRSGAIDLALAALESTGSNLAYELIERENIGILAGRDSGIARNNLSGTPLNVDAAGGDSFVYLTKGHSARIIQDKLFRKYGLNPHVLLETDSLEVGRRVAVEAGACMILRPPAPGRVLPIEGLRKPPAFLRLLPQGRVHPQIHPGLHPHHHPRPLHPAGTGPGIPHLRFSSPTLGKSRKVYPIYKTDF